MEDLTVNEVMTHLVVTLRPQDKINDAAKRLLSNRISGAPVVEGRRLVGVVSESDLVRAFTARRRRSSFPAAYPLMFALVRAGEAEGPDSTVTEQVMTKDVITIGPTDSIWEAASLMDRHGVRRLPVVDSEGFVVGIVARSDLVRCMARSYEQSKAS